jgi:hypothetical protein
MPVAHFFPYVDAIGARQRGCLTCAHFQGEFHCGHVVCEQKTKHQVIGRPELGCAYWQREPGADDEQGRSTCHRPALLIAGPR